MAQPKGKRKNISKHLLEMKFMKKSRDRILQEEEQEDCSLLFYNNLSDELKSSSSKYIVENSFAICENLKCGRRSYKGMNPILEKIIQMENDDKSSFPKFKEEEDVDVTAEEMVMFRNEQSSLTETIAKKFKKAKFQGPTELAKKKRKFLKPSEH